MCSGLFLSVSLHGLSIPVFTWLLNDFHDILLVISFWCELRRAVCVSEPEYLHIHTHLYTQVLVNMLACTWEVSACASVDKCTSVNVCM